MSFQNMIDVLSLFNPIRNDFIYVPESLRIKRSSFTSFDKSLFVLFLSLLSEVENFLNPQFCLLLGHPLQTKGALASRGQGRLLEVDSRTCLFRLTSLETVVGSFRISCPIALKVSPRSKPNWISLRSERVRCLCFVIVDLISNSNVSYLIPP